MSIERDWTCRACDGPDGPQPLAEDRFASGLEPLGDPATWTEETVTQFVVAILESAGEPLVTAEIERRFSIIREQASMALLILELLAAVRDGQIGIVFQGAEREPYFTARKREESPDAL